MVVCSLLSAALLSVLACNTYDRGWRIGCELGDVIGYDNGNLDANLCLPLEGPHLPGVHGFPVAANRHERAVIEGFEDCYYGAYQAGYADTIPFIDCD